MRDTDLTSILNASRTLWRRHRFLFLGFVAAVAVTVFFAGRLLFFTVYWADPAHRGQRLEEWMTPGYVAHSYNLPADVVREALELDAGGGKRRTLAVIMETSDLTLEEIQRRIDAAAQAHEGGQD
jgi:hypothetical protein